MFRPQTTGRLVFLAPCPPLRASSASPFSCHSRLCQSTAYSSLPSRPTTVGKSTPTGETFIKTTHSTKPAATTSTPSSAIPTTTTVTSSTTAKDEDDDDSGFVPRPLGMPIGLANCPLQRLQQERQAALSGSGTGSKSRFLDLDRNKAVRKEITRELSIPYFRDLANLQHHAGKTFIANNRIFTAAAARFFPNFRGVTLATPSKQSCTADITVCTDTAPNQISIVAIVPNEWAQTQVNTFLSNNPELDTLIEQETQTVMSQDNKPTTKSRIQLIEICIEPGWLKACLQRLFFYRLRASRPVEQHSRYFFVRNRVEMSVREAIGLMNLRIGYIYLLDSAGRIRWAASAGAEMDEKDQFVRAIKRLLSQTTGSSAVSTQ